MKGSDGNNIWLAGSTTFLVNDALTEGASLYVSAANAPRDITFRYHANNTELPGTFFHSDDFEYSVVEINGGTVNARSRKGGAGIGSGGCDDPDNIIPSGGTVNISGGTLTVNGSDSGASIGSSFYAGGFDVNITGGNMDLEPDGKTTYVGIGIGRGFGPNPTTSMNVHFGWTESGKADMKVTTSFFSTKTTFDSDFKDTVKGNVYLRGSTTTPKKTVTLVPLETVPDLCSVNFQPGDDSAEGEIENVKSVKDTVYPLPECDYVVAGKDFKEWSVAIGDADPVSMQPEHEITVSVDTWHWIPAYIRTICRIQMTIQYRTARTPTRSRCQC